MLSRPGSLLRRIGESNAWWMATYLFWKHLSVVTRHRWYVMLECFRHGLIWQGLVHDLSKFHPVEFFESAHYYTGVSSPIDEAKKANGRSMAWLHHKGRNKHHWEYWVDFTGGRTIPCRIPLRYLKEMACDMIGASKAYGNAVPTITYFNSRKDFWLMDPEDKVLLARLVEDYVC